MPAFRQRTSTREERLAEGDFDVSEAEVEAAQENIATVGVAATQKQYKDPVGGAKNSPYYQPVEMAGSNHGQQGHGNGHGNGYLRQ